MSAPFFTAALLAFVLTLAGLGGIGLLAAQFLAPPARLPRFNADTFVILAPGWACDLDDTEYVCWKGKPPLAAIAVIAMKRRGPQDNLAAHEEHLRTPQPGSDGAPSTIRSVERRSLAGYECMEAIHVSSEIRDYITIISRL